MKKNKQKRDKELYKKLLGLLLGGTILGGTLTTFLLYTFCSILSFQLSLPIQIVLGFLIGGSTTVLTVDAIIKDSLENNNYEEDTEYEEYESVDEEKYEDEFIQEKVSSLEIVKQSGSNYNYKFKDNERPKLEIVNSDKKPTNKRR